MHKLIKKIIPKILHRKYFIIYYTELHGLDIKLIEDIYKHKFPDKLQ